MKAKEKITIRHANVDDAQEMKRCAEAAYQRYTFRLGKPPAPMLVDYTSIAARGEAFVAQIDGKVVGILVFAICDDRITLDNVAVFPEYQGKGIGRRLVQFAEDEAGRRGFPTLDLYTNEAMTENVAIYTRLGYVEFDRRSEEGYRRGHGVRSCFLLLKSYARQKQGPTDSRRTGIKEKTALELIHK